MLEFPRTALRPQGPHQHRPSWFRTPFGARLLVATPSADAAVFAAARRGSRRGTEPATVPTTCAMYATALPQTIRAARSSLPRMDRADASIAWALPLL